MILAKIFIILFIFADMYKDGRWKRTGKLSYWTKYLMYISILGFAYFCGDSILRWELYVSILLLKKPISDISYSIGYKSKGIYIGETNWTDKLMHKIGLVRIEREKFPIITFIYLLLIFTGIFL